MVIGGDIRLHGDGRFVFVQEELYQNVVGAFLTVEDQLEVRRHRDEFVNGNGFVQVLEISPAAHCLPDAHQVSQREKGTVMGETERQRRLARADYLVGDTDDTVADGRLSLVHGRGTGNEAAAEQYAGIDSLPGTEPFVFGKDIGERQVEFGYILEI